MRPFYPFPSEEESVNDKTCSCNISTTTSANAVTMENIELMFQKMFHDNNSKSNSRNKNKSPLIAQGHDSNVLPTTYRWSCSIT